MAKLFNDHILFQTHPPLRGVVVITTAQLNSTKFKAELRFVAGSNPALSVSKIRDGEDL